jgi:hypothetical protein
MCVDLQRIGTINDLQTKDPQALAKPLAWVLRDISGDFRRNVLYFMERKICYLDLDFPYSESVASSLRSPILFL